jgi:hypothetical protein
MMGNYEIVTPIENGILVNWYNSENNANYLWSSTATQNKIIDTFGQISYVGDKYLITNGVKGKYLDTVFWYPIANPY